MKAYLKQYRQSPRKVRLVADMIRGKKADKASFLLDNTAKFACQPISKLLKSALANAKNQGFDESALFIKELKVDAGPVMKRFMPRARGSSAVIRKRTCNVALVLGHSDGTPTLSSSEKASSSKTENKPVEKKEARIKTAPKSAKKPARKEKSVK